jgi:opacity protein-like surface antigen
MRSSASRVVAAAAAFVLAASAAGAQGAGSAKTVHIGGALGATVPLGDFSDGFSTGWHAGALLEFKQPSWPLGLRFEGTYHKNSVKNGSDEYDADFTQINGVANITYDFSKGESMTPYFIGGLGLYHVKYGVELLGTSGSASDTKLGFNVGGGLKFPLTGFTAFIEGRLHIVNTEGSSTKYIPLSFGIVF